MFVRMFVHVFFPVIFVLFFVPSLYNLLFKIQNIILGQRNDRWKHNEGKSGHFINYLCHVYNSGVDKFLQFRC